MKLTDINNNSLERLALFGNSSPLMRILEEEKLSYLDSGFKKSIFNIIQLHSNEGLELSKLKEAMDFNENRLRNFELRIHDELISDDLTKFLEEENLQVLETNHSFLLEIKDNSPIEEAKYETSAVVDKQGVIDFAYVLASQFEPMDVDVIHFYNKIHQKLLANENFGMLSVYHDGAIAGVAEYFIDSQKNAVLHHLAVVNEEQGKGIGQSLLQAVIEELKVKKINTLAIQTVNDTAPYFEKLSCQLIGKTTCFGRKA
ncbi:GNAT family N-acetyltransferase [Sediminitomix flava]|uniref:Acetyltransferase (GNAT) family protein n=1 Tax=Sediminitomix flava TaxID=379075 RepID=A0A315ZH47_SEDFL|nr:GNAT family N-acetyltransferase [Sediminitomix flava]PWJ44044.1 acetyltransferase (GNAT) family protein [Sediminitomix flava]